MSNQTFEERWLREFVARVKHRMGYLGITRPELARRSGITTSAIGSWFRYRNGPTAISIVKIAKVLIVKPEYLIDFPNLEQTEE